MVYKFNGIETKADTATLTAPIDGHNHPFVEHFKFLRDLVKDEDVIMKFTIPSPSQFYFELILHLNTLQRGKLFIQLKRVVLKRLKRICRCHYRLIQRRPRTIPILTTVHGAL